MFRFFDFVIAIFACMIRKNMKFKTLVVNIQLKDYRKVNMRWSKNIDMIELKSKNEISNGFANHGYMLQSKENITLNTFSLKKEIRI